MHSFDWPQTGIVDVDLINHRLRILTKVHGRINMKAFAFEFPYANFALKPVVLTNGLQIEITNAAIETPRVNLSWRVIFSNRSSVQIRPDDSEPSSGAEDDGGHKDMNTVCGLSNGRQNRPPISRAAAGISPQPCQRSSAMSPWGWLQQINRLPAAGGSTGSGR
jgi:hypothetical protein